jgi:PAS domain S-box-containing protein
MTGKSAAKYRFILRRYGVALLAVLLALALRKAVDPILGERAPFFSFFLAMIFSAWYGGFGPAMFSLLLGTAFASYYFQTPRHSLYIEGVDAQLIVVLQFIVGTATALMSNSQQRAQRRAEEFAAQAAARGELLRITLESIGDAVVATDGQARVTFLNHVAQSLSGWSPGEATGQQIDQIVATAPQGDAATRGSTNPSPFRTNIERPVSGFAWLQTRGASFRPIDYTLSAIRDEQGTKTGSVLVFRDMSLRERAAELFQFLAQTSITLAESLDLEQVLANIVRLPLGSRADWCLVRVTTSPDDTRWKAAHSDPTKESLLVDLQTGLTLDSTDGARLVDATDATIQRSTTTPGAAAALRALAVRSWVIVPLAIRQRRLGMLCLGRGELGRRFLDDDLGWAEEFARRAAAAIENARLYGEAKDADRRKDEFLAMLAHELRNPLAPLRNCAYLLEQAPDRTPEDRQALQSINRQIGHLARLVDDLLDVARITRGKIELRKQVVDARELIEAAADAARPLMQAAGLEFFLNLPEVSMTIDADPVRFAQIVANLLNNAAKYTPIGGRVWLNAQATERSLLIRIRDTGIGIAPVMREQIFELFAQAQGSFDRNTGGLGIGLTLVRRLVEMHGGSVEATSSGVGKGSEFTVTLPLAMGEVTPAIPVASTAPPRLETPVPTVKILVVDDNREALRSMLKLLKLWKYDAVGTEDPYTAIDLSMTEHPDIVLLDIGLPQMNGFDLARELRRQTNDKPLHLVAVTGYGQEADQQRSSEAGIDRHLVKPIDPAALERLLADLASRNQRAALPAT